MLDGFDARPVLSDRGPRDGDVDLDAVREALDIARSRHASGQIEAQARNRRWLAEHARL